MVRFGVWRPDTWRKARARQWGGRAIASVASHAARAIQKAVSHQMPLAMFKSDG